MTEERKKVFASVRSELNFPADEAEMALQPVINSRGQAGRLHWPLHCTALASAPSEPLHCTGLRSTMIPSVQNFRLLYKLEFQLAMLASF